ncbi:Autophagy-related protein 16-1 [Gracilaria domingensis]|nr:Autophagy-related protein 16-1 [Gracilaria domingensis]
MGEDGTSQSPKRPVAEPTPVSKPQATAKQSSSSQKSNTTKTSSARPPSASRRTIPPEDDPRSELNVLRREVRKLQAEVRDAAMQVAAQQDEIVSLREALSAAEAEAEDALSRESNLRVQLQAQRLHRQRIEGTMAAAEALVASLRDMITEQTFTQGPSFDDAPKGPASSSENDLDLILSRISDGADLKQTSDVSQLQSNVLSAENSGVDPEVISIDMNDLQPLSQTANEIGDTAPTTSSGIPLIATSLTNRPASFQEAPTNTEMNSQPSLVPTPGRHPQRHSMPVVPTDSVSPTPSHATSNLLLSAFGQATNAPRQASTIRSSGVHAADNLPPEVAPLAKGEDAMFRVHSPQSLPNTGCSRACSAHSGEIYAIASTLDGNWIASGGDDRVVNIYNSLGTSCASISESPRSITALQFHHSVEQNNAEFNVIFSGSSDGSIRSLKKHPRRRGKWTLGAVFPVHTQAVRRMIFTNSSSQVLSCSSDRTIKVSDIENAKRPFAATATSAVLDIDMFESRNGLVVSGHKDGCVRMWSLKDQSTCIGGSKLHTKGIVSVACLADGHGVVSLGRDNIIRLSDTRMNTVGAVREMDGMIDTVSDWHRLSVSGQHVSCGMGRQGDVGFWNADSGKLMRRITSQASASDADVIDMVTRKLRNPGSVVVPHWTPAGQFVCAHRMRQVSFWGA